MGISWVIIYSPLASVADVFIGVLLDWKAPFSPYKTIPIPATGLPRSSFGTKYHRSAVVCLTTHAHAQHNGHVEQRFQLFFHVSVVFIEFKNGKSIKNEVGVS